MEVLKTPSPRTGLDWLTIFALRLERWNVDVELGTEAARYLLQQQGGEAVTISDADGATLLFRDERPSASAVLEEVAHAAQARAGAFAELDVREMICRREIEAKSCLVRVASRLSIPQAETDETCAQLAREEAILRTFESWR